MIQRFDIHNVSGSSHRKIMPNGFLKTDATVTRSGVFVYRRADGSTVRELRLPEEVFKADSLESLAGVPMTNGHPKTVSEMLGKDGLLDAQNTKFHQIGFTGDSPRQDGNKVTVGVTVTDGQAIKDIDAGRKQLSCGYMLERIDETPGVFEGEPYDRVQRGIHYNHLALVEKARGGDSLQLRLDSGDAIMETENQSTGGADMPRVRIDEVDYEVSETAAGAITGALKRRDDRITEIEKDRDKERARADSAEADRDKAKKEAEEQRLDSEDMAKAVRYRMGLLEAARKVITDEEKVKRLDSMSDNDLAKEIILSEYPDAKLDDASETYLEGRLDSALANITSRASKAGDLNQRTKGAGSGKGGNQRADSLDEVRHKYLNTIRDAWKQEAS